MSQGVFEHAIQFLTGSSLNHIGLLLSRRMASRVMDCVLASTNVAELVESSFEDAFLALCEQDENDLEEMMVVEMSSHGLRASRVSDFVRHKTWRLPLIATPAEHFAKWMNFWWGVSKDGSIDEYLSEQVVVDPDDDVSHYQLADESKEREYQAQRQKHSLYTREHPWQKLYIQSSQLDTAQKTNLIIEFLMQTTGVFGQNPIPRYDFLVHKCFFEASKQEKNKKRMKLESRDDGHFKIRLPRRHRACPGHEKYATHLTCSGFVAELFWHSELIDCVGLLQCRATLPTHFLLDHLSNVRMPGLDAWEFREKLQSEATFAWHNEKSNLLRLLDPAE
jgi:hypothetical protein